MDGPGVNAVGPDLHRELADVWLAVDRDPDVRVAIIQGAGKGFSSGGSFELLEDMLGDYAARTQVLREARDLVYNVIELLEAHRVGDPRSGRRGGARRRPARRHLGRRPLRPHHRRSHPPRRRRRRPRRDLLAAAVRDGEGEVLPAHLRDLTGEEAERIGLVSLCVDDDELFDTALEIAIELATGAQSAIRWTKHTLNNWYRMLGPAFDASLGLEFYGFGGPDAAEGLAALREKRAAEFTGPTSE